MKEYLKFLLEKQKILILGYGREGRSTLNLLSETIPYADITVADYNSNAINSDNLIATLDLKTQSGNDYLNNLDKFDVIIKSPGISLRKDLHNFNPKAITSQTELFLLFYREQVIGITGTKGKSTTSSLIYHILKTDSSDVVMGGNMGIPVFDLVKQISPTTKIVCELSSHQLQYTRHSPRISILLNIFQEHLDHYDSYKDYQLAKYNIARHQEPGDYFIYNAADSQINELISNYPAKGEKLPNFIDIDNANGISIKGDAIILKTSEYNKKILPVNFQSTLTGEHNRSNIIMAAAAATLMDIRSKTIVEALNTFIPLEHRLEYAGSYNSVRYYNDSISTIPESAIAAIETLKPVNTLILGGFNRGVDYSNLIEYLKKGNVAQIVTTGPAGFHINKLIKNSNLRLKSIHVEKFDNAVRKAIKITSPGGICLLSPAASSYNEFKNFEERGKRFKEIIMHN